jgi:dTDP-4-dehydrorhamnose reductase
MAGHMIASYFKQQKSEILTLGRDQSDEFFDILNPVTHKVLERCLCCDVVINCTGLLIAESNRDPVSAYLVNSWFPHYLVTLLSTTGARLLHLSTDCVFDGQSGPYTENSQHTETSVYGRSKSFGEIHSPSHLTLRTSIIGPELRKNSTGLFDWFLYKSPPIVTGYTDAWWNGITTLELAKHCWTWCIKPCVFGVYHLTRNDYLTKYEVLNMLNTEWTLNKILTPGLAPKPVNKCLINSHPTVFEIKPFVEQLTELRLWMHKNNNRMVYD